MSTRRRQQTRSARIVGTLLALGVATTAAPAVGANSLATPITSELQQALWPVELGVEIRRLDRDDEEGAAIEAMPIRTVVVPDGNRVEFSSAIWTPRGRRDFSIELAAHQHPRDEIEMEWDLVVEDAPYETVSVADYLLHRLRFGPRPDVGPDRVRVARADIITVKGEPHVELVDIDGENYEIRMFALKSGGPRS